MVWKCLSLWFSKAGSSQMMNLPVGSKQRGGWEITCSHILYLKQIRFYFMPQHNNIEHIITCKVITSNMSASSCVFTHLADKKATLAFIWSCVSMFSPTCTPWFIYLWLVLQQFPRKEVRVGGGAYRRCCQIGPSLEHWETQRGCRLNMVKCPIGCVSSGQNVMP